MLKKVGILANGGDVSGFNAVIRAIVKTAENHGVECYGIIDGYNGLIKKDFELLSTAEGGEALGILPKGGSIIGSSTNANLFNYKVVNEDGSVEYKDLSDEAIQNIKDFGFDCIFTLGGDGTQKSARDFSTKGVNVIGVPKTIDNDVACTEITFGYNTAVSVAMEALDRLHTTGATHHRIMVLEVMGRYAGWIALESAIAGGADVALIPEIPYDIHKAAEAINHEAKRLEKLSLQLLDLYVFQNESVELELLNLFAIGEQTKATLKHLSEKYNVLFTVNFQNEWVYANSVLLLSLLYNLADNAFKASNPQTCVEIYSQTENDTIKISVEDKGSGISKENIKYITEPFFRADKSRSRKYGGAGLGLSLCKEIASLHGSELHFESETDKGTLVWFTLKKEG